MEPTRARAATRLTLLTLCVLLVLALAGAGGYLLTWHERTAAARTPARAAPPTPAAVRAATSPATPVAPASSTPSPPTPGRAALAAALAPLLRAKALGSGVAADVIDPATGADLYAAHADRTEAPASTAKLLTAAAVLTVRPSTYRIPTVVRADRNGTLVLVGGGDPTLTAARPGTSGPYPEAARLSDLAQQVAHTGQPVHRIVVDDGLFSGPAVSPAWAAEDVPSSYASAITPVMADGGRAAPGDAVRSAAPDLAAGHELAGLLHQPGLPVSRGTYRGNEPVIAQVRSAPLSALVEQMLQESDNVIAECLARQVAIAQNRPVSFLGAAAAIRQTLSGLQISVGDGMVDGSGLAARDRLSPATLTGVLEAAVRRPSLAPLLAGLPVAAGSGTLADRYTSGATAGAAGVVRAKTGTLTGVSTLAGLVHDTSGRLLAFAVMADHVGSTPAAETALDRVAARLAACRCHGPGG